jgi:predicted phage terminase large subunit-like protein
MSTVIELRPQAGPQTIFLTSPADIVVYGGSAGGGKTWALLMECLRNINNSRFSAVIFRRSFPQIKAPGGLWDASMQIYPLVGGRSRQTTLTWDFPGGAKVEFRHLKLDRDVLAWQGAEVPLICFDELTHFSESQFWYLLSRNRSTCGVRPYIRCTTNPDADSWVRKLIDWWLDEDGYPDLTKAGVVRYFIRENGEIKWVDADWRDEMGIGPKSFTFIPSSIYDNPALLQKDPGYLANLRSLSLVDRERLLGQKGKGGNWNTKAVAGKVFRQDWFEVVDQVPSILPGQAKLCRFWDFAATTKKLQGDDPDFTCGVKLMLLDGVTYVLDVIAIQTTPTEIDRLVQNTASQDGRWCMVRWEQEGGASGVRDSARLMQMLRGFDARGIHPEINKVGRAKPFSRVAEFGQVKLVRGAWNQAYLNELSQFPDGAHDDQVDASSGAFNELTGADVSRTSTGTFRV